MTWPSCTAVLPAHRTLVTLSNQKKELTAFESDLRARRDPVRRSVVELTTMGLSGTAIAGVPQTMIQRLIAPSNATRAAQKDDGIWET